jgi:hypothetical protein
MRRPPPDAGSNPPHRDVGAQNVQHIGNEGGRRGQHRRASDYAPARRTTANLMAEEAFANRAANEYWAMPCSASS